MKTLSYSNISAKLVNDFTCTYLNTSEARSVCPEARLVCPEARSVCPKARSVCPEARSVCPEARSVCPEARFRGGGGKLQIFFAEMLLWPNVFHQF